MSEHGGGPAFPVLHSIDGNWVRDPRPEYVGMSLRDWFAGQALAGLMIHRPINWTIDEVVAEAGRIADAMLAERQRS